MPSNSSVEVIAFVLEQGGTVPHSGTHVTFTTTLGLLEPSVATTDASGRANTRFHPGSQNGTAVINAASGGATTAAAGALTIVVGTAGVGRVVVTANPASVANNGGSVAVTASVLDVNGNVLPQAAVTFTTTAGSLSNGVAITDATGIARTTLTTTQEATVTASVGTPATQEGAGAFSGSVVVKVTAVPNLVITPPSTPPSVGLPAAFTFSVTTPPGANTVRDVVVRWGDGSSQNLGAITQAVVTHVYSAPGSYVVSATVTDNGGGVSTVSTAVTVIPVPRPTIIVTPSPQTQTVGGTIIFVIQVTVPPGIGVQSTAIDFGDGTSAQLGGASSASVPHQYSSTGTKSVVVTVSDTTGQVTTGTTSVSITP